MSSGIGSGSGSGSGRLLIRASADVTEAQSSASGLLGRLRAFLPEMAAANAELESLTETQRAAASIDPGLLRLSESGESSESETEKERAEEQKRKRKQKSSEESETVGVEMDVAMFRYAEDEGASPPKKLVEEVADT